MPNKDLYRQRKKWITMSGKNMFMPPEGNIPTHWHSISILTCSQTYT